MQFNRLNLIYRNGLLAEQHRHRVSFSSSRYKRSWTVSRVVELTDAEVDQYPQHCVRADDTGARVVYSCTERLGFELNKRQALALLG
jgi:hypothetical protein